MNQQHIAALRMERQHLTRQADETEYDALYRDLQPGQNVYWSGFGDPPSLTRRAAFDDMEYNRLRQRQRKLLKGRFQGGNLGWIEPADLELFAGLSMKPLKSPTDKQSALLSLIQREGPMTIQQMKETTGMLVKEITPALHRLQEAFLIYEDQYDGEWDRGWYIFPEMFPNADLTKYSRHDALKIVLRRFAYRHVLFDANMAKSFYKLPEKDIKAAITALSEEEVLMETEYGLLLSDDYILLQNYDSLPSISVYAMHRNDFLVKSNEHWLKERFTHLYPDTLYYLLTDGEFRGVVAGKFRYTPEVEDVLVDISDTRRDEVLQAVRALCGTDIPIKRYRSKSWTNI